VDREVNAALALAFWSAIFLCAPALAHPVVITGVVRDVTGAVIPGATVTLRSEHSTQTANTGPDGEFSFRIAEDSSATIHVEASGFATAEQVWSASTGAAERLTLKFTLRSLAHGERIVVSATRTEMKLSEVPGSALELSTVDVEANPALALDDVLRQVPGFSLFRRSSSRVANPTTQGVSLRGVGASGPSRALVLENGVPLVDPFGGWIYWDRVPRASLSSVEVSRGGASSLYGSAALGGVIQFITRVPAEPSFSIDTSYGTENTPGLSAWGGTVFSRWDISAAADMFRTDGYILVPSSRRGPVDTAANSEHATVDATLGYKLSDSGRVYVRGGFFDESRNNGTPLQVNSTGLASGAAGVNTAIGAHDWLSARVFGLVEGYDQTFSSISTARNTETLSDIQHVPSQQAGTALQWNHVLKGHTLIAGLDFQEIMGASDELLPLASATNIAGGRQRSTGLFAQDIFRVANKWTIIAGARWDDWNNFRGSSVRTSIPSGTPTTTTFPDRSENAFSPRVSVMRALNHNLALSVSGYRAFRAPTLNELYRTFRQGSITTNNNPLLRAERLTGAETSLRATAFSNKLEARGTFFWADIVDPVTNVTLTATTRQRQNLGRTRSLGAELDGAVHVTSAIEISAGYQYTHAYVEDSSPALIGKWVPEVPRHQLTWEARYWNPNRLMLSVQGRFSGSQYDDDLNTLKLGQYYVTNLFLGRRIRAGLTAYIAAENLFNQRYAVTLTPPPPPIVSLGAPILARVGIRYDFPGR
jgi:outer membrane receptor protein involved in Fe transport